MIATSSGAAAAYLREGFSNIRIGMFLEIATTLGALFGAFLAASVSTKAIGIVFGLVLLYSVGSFLEPHARRIGRRQASRSAGHASGMNGTYPSLKRPQAIQRPPRASRFQPDVRSRCASGLLGIGSGAVKVLAMDHAMGFLSRSPPPPAIS